MSYTQLGYPYTASGALGSSQVLHGSAGMGSTSHSNTPAACDSNRSNNECQYPTTPLLPPAYTSLPSLSDYSNSVYSHMQQFRPDTSAFYNPLVPQNTGCYDPKEGVELWRSAATASAACYTPYDPSYPYTPGYPQLPLNGAQRKNATREATSTLKAWLHDHIKNPYPTKGEKIMLAIITKMTLTQVSTWFANARRRLKKENKMTWSPRNRCEDDDEEDMDDDDKHKKDSESEKKSESESAENAELKKEDCSTPTAACSSFGSPTSLLSTPSSDTSRLPTKLEPPRHITDDDKPRIWSVSDVLTSNAVATSLPTTLSARSAWCPLPGAASGIGGASLTKPLGSLPGYPLSQGSALGLNMYNSQMNSSRLQNNINANNINSHINRGGPLLPSSDQGMMS